MTTTPAALTDNLMARHLQAIGTTATVVVQAAEDADRAEVVLADELRRIDEACSRFRADSELEELHRRSGETLAVSPLLFQALEIACEVAHRTRGVVDPTVGNAIAALGYDADLAEVQARHDAPPPVLQPVAGYSHVQLSPSSRSVRIPRGVRLDLGASAKALAADRAATRLAHELDQGVLVSLGGDVAVAGQPPFGGWAIGIAADASLPPDQADQVVAISHGGLASSSVAVRRWRAGQREVHHLVDPRTGDCAASYWTLVSAVGPTCVDANAVTTAAMVLGAEALEFLAPFGQAMRLVRHDGEVVTLNGWPEAVLEGATGRPSSRGAAA